MLQVKLHQARGLSLAESIGFSDPSCIVTVEGTTSKASLPKALVQKAKEPNVVWNKTLYFEVDADRIKGAIVLIQVYDELNDGNMHPIGSVAISLNNLQTNVSAEQRYWYKLQNGSGEVDVGFIITSSNVSQHSPLSESLPAPLPSAQSEPITNIKRAETVGPWQHTERKSPDKALIQYQSSELRRDHPHIARGGFGIVYKGYVPKIDSVVVIKDLEVKDQKSVDDWRKEVGLMSQHRSPFIAEIYGYSAFGNTLTIVMEFMPKGDLFGILHKHPEKHQLSLIQRMRMARHCVLGLAYLHQNGIIHRDIKSMNVLVNDDYSCKITDLGCAKAVNIQEANKLNTVATGTPLWMAPEVRFSANYGTPADIFSVGLVLYELFEKKLPDFDQQRMVVVLPPTYKSEVLIKPCLQLDPVVRPNAEQLISALDITIKNTCEALSDMLPLSVNEKLKPENENSDSLEQHLVHLYRHLLSMPAIEVDQLIDKAYSKEAAKKPLKVEQPIELEANNKKGSVKPGIFNTKSKSKYRGPEDGIAITIKSGRGLKAGDINGSSDPYCKIICEGIEYKTQTISHTLNPVWNYTFFVPKTTKIVTLKIDCWDKDSVKSDDFLGQCIIDLDLEKSSDIWVPLEKRPNHKKEDKGVKGDINIVVTL